MKLRTIAVFGVGYVLGAKAGRERYGQIIAAAQNASKRLEDSGRLETFSEKFDSFRGTLDGLKDRLQEYATGQGTQSLSGTRAAP